eukprot:scaffold3854_cov107-Isochrysis_galbana.AAC.4
MPAARRHTTLATAAAAAAMRIRSTRVKNWLLLLRCYSAPRTLTITRPSTDRHQAAIAHLPAPLCLLYSSSARADCNCFVIWNHSEWRAALAHGRRLQLQHRCRCDRRSNCYCRRCRPCAGRHLAYRRVSRRRAHLGLSDGFTRCRASWPRTNSRRPFGPAHQISEDITPSSATPDCSGEPHTPRACVRYQPGSCSYIHTYATMPRAAQQLRVRAQRTAPARCTPRQTYGCSPHWIVTDACFIPFLNQSN